MSDHPTLADLDAALPFVERHIGLRPDQMATMLERVGFGSLEELMAAAVPGGIRSAEELELPRPLTEEAAARELRALAAHNRPGEAMIGLGYHATITPPVIRRNVLEDPSWYTAYTPYQPEVSQGVLQALFEYQTMLTRLTGVEIANASLYDGATACVEAVNLAVAATGRSEVWVSGGVHPQWREVVRTFAAGTGHSLVDVPLVDGISQFPSDGAPGAILLQYPNYLGCLDDIAGAAAVAKSLGALLLVAFDPVAGGLLRSPGSYGADVVVGEGQPFGTPLSFGGPYLGLFACRQEHVRRLPGRLVGETVDTEGRRAYVTTLRAREQDIRREKASSNVCTNQTLIAVCCVIQMAWLGTTGLRELALRCARGTRYAREALLGIDGVAPVASAPVFREFGVRAPVPGEVIVERMAEEGFLAGVPLDDGGLLVAVTEKRTRAQIDAYVTAFEKVIR